MEKNMQKKYYVYKWYNVDTNEVFYIGKGCGRRSGQVTNRNQIFKDYYNTHNCSVEKLAYFDDEKEALKYENELILFYKSQNQAIANLDNGGKGGLSFVWTKQMRQYKSKYNPMKDWQQQLRMSQNNPMKNPSISEKVAKKIRRPVIIDGKEYEGVKIAAESLGVAQYTIINWCHRGYNTDGKPCHYKNEQQKIIPEMKKLGARVNNAKPIIIDNIYYSSVKAGAKAINGNSEGIIRAIKANRTYKGHICNYANQQPSQENNQ